MIQIHVDSLEVYAKINYLRDISIGLHFASWETVKEEYLEEAKFDRDIVLTLEEIDTIMKKLNLL